MQTFRAIVLLMLTLVLVGCRASGSRTPAPPPATQAPPAASAPAPPAAVSPAPAPAPAQTAAQPFDWHAANAAVRRSLADQGIHLSEGELRLWPVSLDRVVEGHPHKVAAVTQTTLYVAAVSADYSRATVVASLSDQLFANGKLEVSGRGDTLKVWWQAPYRASQMTMEIRWAGTGLSKGLVQADDPTAAFYQARTELIGKGDIEAVMQMPIKDVLYPQQYPEWHTHPPLILRLAHTRGLEAFRGGDLPGALRLMEYGVKEYTRVYPLFEQADERAIPAPDLAPIVNDYAFLLAESGRNAEAEPLLRQVVKAAPERAVAYINLGDVLWSLGRQADAREHYQRYLDLLGSGRSQAPQRVFDRLK